MSTLKQIEVNGTTYDIGIPGSECPIICETYTVSGHPDIFAVANALHEKQYAATGMDYTYSQIDSLIFIRTQEGSSERVIVIALPEEDNSGE